MKKTAVDLEENRDDFNWIGKENAKVFSQYNKKVKAEESGHWGKILCFWGLHKWEACGLRYEKARVGIMSHYFGCVRCRKDKNNYWYF